jgi:hypothetical protein
VLRHESRTCDKDPPAQADPLHLKVSVGIKPRRYPRERDRLSC